jgi:hypothetical protein
MSWRRRWVVLVPGELAWVERRTREILEEEEDGSEHHYMVVPGQGRYQVVVEKGYQDIGPEMVLGRALSLECEEPVYSIQGFDEFFYVSRFQKGEEHSEDQEPEDLVRALGCANPWTVEPPLKPFKRHSRTVALIKGLSKNKVLRVLEKEVGQPLQPETYRLEETHQGLLLRDGLRPVGSADIVVAERHPRAIVYSVTARPDLGGFVVNVMQGRRVEQFSHPPKDRPLFPVIHEVMGERTPERILAALGIPKEWFRL